MTVFPNTLSLNMWPTLVPYPGIGTNANFKLQIRGFHYSMRNTTVSQIGIKLNHIQQLIEMEPSNSKGKVYCLLDSDQQISELKDVVAGIICPLLGMMLILILKLAMSHPLGAVLPPPFRSVVSMEANPWVLKI
jgi:hypothetical protein